MASPAVRQPEGEREEARERSSLREAEGSRSENEVELEDEKAVPGCLATVSNEEEDASQSSDVFTFGRCAHQSVSQDAA